MYFNGNNCDPDTQAGNSTSQGPGASNGASSSSSPPAGAPLYAGSSPPTLAGMPPGSPVVPSGGSPGFSRKRSKNVQSQGQGSGDVQHASAGLFTPQLASANPPTQDTSLFGRRSADFAGVPPGSPVFPSASELFGEPSGNLQYQGQFFEDAQHASAGLFSPQCQGTHCEACNNMASANPPASEYSLFGQRSATLAGMPLGSPVVPSGSPGFSGGPAINLLSQGQPFGDVRQAIAGLFTPQCQGTHSGASNNMASANSQTQGQSFKDEKQASASATNPPPQEQHFGDFNGYFGSNCMGSANPNPQSQSQNFKDQPTGKTPANPPPQSLDTRGQFATTNPTSAEFQAGLANAQEVTTTTTTTASTGGTTTTTTVTTSKPIFRGSGAAL